MGNAYTRLTGKKRKEKEPIKNSIQLKVRFSRQTLLPLSSFTGIHSFYFLASSFQRYSVLKQHCKPSVYSDEGFSRVLLDILGIEIQFEN